MATAQDEDERWADPNNRFTLSYVELGWSEMPPPPNDPDVVLALEHRTFQASGDMHACMVTVRAEPAPNTITQAQLNEFFFANGLTVIERSTQATSIESERRHVDGVAVIVATFDDPIHQEVLAFYLKDENAAVRVLINCGAAGPAPAEVIDNIGRLFASLRIYPREGGGAT